MKTVLETPRVCFNLQRAVNVQHRIQEDAFVQTAESLLDLNKRYIAFLDSTRKRTEGFEEDIITPVVEAFVQLIGLFQQDMNQVVFTGLAEAVEQEDMVFGPQKDSMDYFVSRVVRNSKLVSLHANNLLKYGYKYEKLHDLLNQTIEYAMVVEESLPRYYSILLNVSRTMETLDFHYSGSTFPPVRLGEDSVRCHDEVNQFAAETYHIEHDLVDVQDRVDHWNFSSHDHSDMVATLKDLYISLYEYGAHLECRVLKGTGSQSGVSVWQHTQGG